MDVVELEYGAEAASYETVMYNGVVSAHHVWYFHLTLGFGEKDENDCGKKEKNRKSDEEYQCYSSYRFKIHRFFPIRRGVLRFVVGLFVFHS